MRLRIVYKNEKEDRVIEDIKTVLEDNEKQLVVQHMVDGVLGTTTVYRINGNIAETVFEAERKNG